MATTAPDDRMTIIADLRRRIDRIDREVRDDLGARTVPPGRRHRQHRARPAGCCRWHGSPPASPKRWCATAARRRCGPGPRRCANRSAMMRRACRTRRLRGCSSPMSACGWPARLIWTRCCRPSSRPRSREIGDRTQLLAILLAAAFSPAGAGDRRDRGRGARQQSARRRSAALCSTTWSIIGAIALMLAIGLILAGASGVLAAEAAAAVASTGGSARSATVALGFFILEFGDKTQLLTMTIAARVDSCLLAGFGAAAGIVLANVPAVLLARRMAPARAAASDPRGDRRAVRRPRPGRRDRRAAARLTG